MATKKKAAKADESALTTAAQALGTALGKLALRTGIATAPAAPVKRKKKAAPKQAAAKKTPAKKKQK
jgi:hypothetical protein